MLEQTRAVICANLNEMNAFEPAGLLSGKLNDL